MTDVAAPIEIRDVADSRLDDFRDLSSVDRRPDRPGGRALVIAEGVPVVQRLLASPYQLRGVLGVVSRIESLAGDLAGVRAPVYVASAEVMAQVVGFHLNRGVLASADRLPAHSVETLIGSAARIAVLEGVNDHENLGSIFRNAAAFGVAAVLLAPGCADPLYRRAVRVSMGHVLAVPFTELAAPSRSTGSPQLAVSSRSAASPQLDVSSRSATMPQLEVSSRSAPSPRFSHWPQAIGDLRAAGFTVLAMTPDPGALALRDLDPAQHPRTAVLVGAEGPGLSAEALEAADLRVRIPMLAGVDSINVATAAAIAFDHLAPPL